ncbi:MAG: hypothetical protein JWO33_2397 [Caulobacteraceae bacterium]|nr:hypothetical protein [Caulobacteraceae bacterium]
MLAFILAGLIALALLQCFAGRGARIPRVIEMDCWVVESAPRGALALPAPAHAQDRWADMLWEDASFEVAPGGRLAEALVEPLMAYGLGGGDFIIRPDSEARRLAGPIVVPADILERVDSAFGEPRPSSPPFDGLDWDAFGGHAGGERPLGVTLH